MLKNKTSTLIIIGIVIALGLLFWLGQPDSNDSNKAANLGNANSGYLSSEENSFNFGSISMAAGKVSHEFKIKNTTDQPLQIAKLYTSCMCTEAFFKNETKKSGPFGMPGHAFVPKLNQTVNPGEEAVIEVVYDPAAHGPAGVGPFERAIYLDGAEANLLTLEIEGTVIP